MTELSVKRTPTPPTPDLGDLLEDVLQQSKSLVQAEFSLARRELVAELRVATGSLVLLVTGVMFLQAALATLGVLIVLALGAGVASAGVVVALAAIGGVALLVARHELAHRKLPRTVARLTLDAKQIAETVK
jgi:hypothetical protein